MFCHRVYTSLFGSPPLGIFCCYSGNEGHAETKDLDTLLAHADYALYRAKAAGRNRTVGWKSGERAQKSVPRRVLKAGRIIFNAYSSTMDCTVRLLSDEGATLTVSSSIGVPDTFTLAIRSDGIEALCRVVAQSEKQIEVEFY